MAVVKSTTARSETRKTDPPKEAPPRPSNPAPEPAAPSADRVERNGDEDEPEDSAGGAVAGLIGGLKEAFGNEPEDPQVVRDREAAGTLDRYWDAYDNPGGGKTDGKVSRGDLEDVASGEFDDEAARERLQAAGVEEHDLDAELERLQEDAEYLLGREELLREIDVANDPGGDPDDEIARSDLHAWTFQAQNSSAQNGHRPFGLDFDGISHQDFELPHEGETQVTRQGEANRTPELIREQENQILEAVAGDGTIEFTNSEGQTENLSVEQETNSGGDVVYRIRGEDGHTLEVKSGLSADDTRTALARIADYYTQVPEGLRHSVDHVELIGEADDEAAADFRSDGDRVRFYDGLNNLNEAVFDHEFAHGIGNEVDGEGEGFLNDLNPFDGDGAGSPDGWEGAIEADGEAVSDYAHTNHKEDFAESWATYVEARDQGPEALEAFQEAYPHRYAILEEVYNDAAS